MKNVYPLFILYSKIGKMVDIKMPDEHAADAMQHRRYKKLHLNAEYEDLSIKYECYFRIQYSRVRRGLSGCVKTIDYCKRKR